MLQLSCLLFNINSWWKGGITQVESIFSFNLRKNVSKNKSFTVECKWKHKEYVHSTNVDLILTQHILLGCRQWQHFFHIWFPLYRSTILSLLLSFLSPQSTHLCCVLIEKQWTNKKIYMSVMSRKASFYYLSVSVWTQHEAILCSVSLNLLLPTVQPF